MQIFSEKVNRLLVDLEKSSGQFWNVPREVAQILYFLVRARLPKRILEIGTSNGYSSIWLAKGLADNSGDFGAQGCLYTVESHQERFEMAANNFQLADLSLWIKQIKGHAPEVFVNDPEVALGDFDMYFFDATKKQHLDFLKMGFPLLKNGGLVVADNVLSHAKEMRTFLDYAEEMGSLRGEVVSVGDGLYLGVKL